MVWLMALFSASAADGFREDLVMQFPASILLARDQSIELDLLQRVEYISESMLGIPYLLNPEGEEEGVDPDPLLRFDRMDCLTYVELVMALSITDSMESTLDVRNELRYLDSEISYQKRKHFMFSQWIPSNLDLGFLSDISSQIGPTYSIERNFKPSIWKYWRGRSKLPLEEYPQGVFQLDVLRVQDAIDNLKKIPSGSLLVVVRDSAAGNPVMVSHVGFVIWKGKKAKIRHATILGKPKSVKEHDLKWYLRHLTTYKWKVAGVAILLPKVPTDQPQTVEEESKIEYKEVNFEDAPPPEASLSQPMEENVDNPGQIQDGNEEENPK
ncbi:MAG: N-acetylmuramoyl-L-alanine amidase-like domain-containing protein [Myxococcota bacterium]|nr:N-acetylmuramoyl-L-alanine amidase-like domain-containing protein [Myxococcota bacterium]